MATPLRPGLITPHYFIGTTEYNIPTANTAGEQELFKRIQSTVQRALTAPIRGETPTCLRIFKDGRVSVLNQHSKELATSATSSLGLTTTDHDLLFQPIVSFLQRQTTVPTKQLEKAYVSSSVQVPLISEESPPRARSSFPTAPRREEPRPFHTTSFAPSTGLAPREHPSISEEELSALREEMETISLQNAELKRKLGERAPATPDLLPELNNTRKQLYRHEIRFKTEQQATLQEEIDELTTQKERLQYVDIDPFERPYTVIDLAKDTRTFIRNRTTPMSHKDIEATIREKNKDVAELQAEIANLEDLLAADNSILPLKLEIQKLNKAIQGEEQTHNELRELLSVNITIEHKTLPIDSFKAISTTGKVKAGDGAELSVFVTTLQEKLTGLKKTNGLLLSAITATSLNP